MSRGLIRRRRSGQPEVEVTINDGDAAWSGQPTRKTCGSCRSVNAMQALQCQVCSVQFSSSGRSGRFARITRASTLAPAPTVIDVDAPVDDPVADDLVARLSQAIMASSPQAG